ncbi:LOG family protein [Candidatus Nomurabacteria bacterium]|nr:LOG family protein [Candidatus Nomurabacteria bacterium]
MVTKRRMQIGVMGSAADLNYSKSIEMIAEQIGRDIALSGNICVYGAEKDYDSLSTAAARGAKSAGGITVGVTYGKGKDIWDSENNTDVIICTGIERGGGREFVLVNSCDAIIAISGGSGTLTELAIAYQSNLPMIVIVGTGGWADKLANTFFDARNRRMVIGSTPENAVEIALNEINKNVN